MSSPNHKGFSLLELLVAVTIIFILAALAVPSLMTQVYAIRIRYSATELSGLLQAARMESVRLNTYYSVQGNGGNPVVEQVVDKTGVVAKDVPQAMMASSVAVFFGPGSGAPGEGAFVGGLNFAVANGAAGLPSFNARGLPCVPVGVTCPVTAGQGFVFFLSRTSSTGGSSGWTAVVVTPSGRCQVWAYDGANWLQL